MAATPLSWSSGDGSTPGSFDAVWPPPADAAAADAGSRGPPGTPGERHRERPTVLLSPGRGLQVVTPHGRVPAFTLGTVRWGNRPARPAELSPDPRACATRSPGGSAQPMGAVFDAVARYPTPPLAPAEFSFSDVMPFMAHYTLDLPACGIRLVFDNHSQLLTAAQVRNCRAAQVMYQNEIVSSPTPPVPSPAHAPHMPSVPAAACPLTVWPISAVRSLGRRPAQAVSYQTVCDRLGPARAGWVDGQLFVLPYDGALPLPVRWDRPGVC